MSNSRLSSCTDTEDEDSGIITDYSECSPAEDMTFDFDYEDLLVELTDGGFSEIPCIEDLEIYQHELETQSSLILPDVTNKNTEGVNSKLIEVNSYCKECSSEQESTHSLEDIGNSSKNPKLVSFSREQAREWRRKRILNPHTAQHISATTTTTQKPRNLKPLMPLPGKLRPPPVANKNKKLDASKLLDPLQGGEKISSSRGVQPMKLRAFPESFWREPQSVHTSSLSRSNYNVLPPIFSAEGTSTDDVKNIRPVTPPDERSDPSSKTPPDERSRSPRYSPRHKKRWTTTAPPDTELLFRLFDHLENKVDEKRIVRRGRPKKIHIEKIPAPPKNYFGEDPCIVDDLATKLFPDLSLNNNKHHKTSDFAIVRIKKGENTIEFPAIQTDQNYSTMLNELATHM